MNTPYSYPELQQRFCEGFIFLPFNNLEQYGSFIYKRYGQAAGLEAIIEHLDVEYNLCGLHAQMLQLMMQQRNIPAAATLLLLLEEAGRLFGDRCDGRYALFFGQLLEATATYADILFVFQRDVQQNIEKQLAGMEKPAYTIATDVNANSVRHIQVVITELINSTDIIHDFLYDLIPDGYNCNPPVLTGITAGMLKTLVGRLKQYRLLMEKTVYILKQWEREIIQIYRKQVMN